MIKKILLPSLAAILLSGCVSTAEKQAKDLNDRRMINSIRYPSTARLKYTLDRGADPNLKDQYGVPVLTRAVAAKKVDHINMLLDRGADIHGVDMDGETAAFAAVSLNDIAILELLVKKGASLHVSNKIGKTLAMEAARLGHLDMLKYLLDKGVDVNAVDQNTASIAAYAASSEENAVEMLKYLESKGLKVDIENTNLLGSPFLRALFYDRVETAILLLSRMQELNADDRMKQIGRLAAYYAISHDRIDLLKALIDKKLELDYIEPFSFKFVNLIKVDGIYKLAARNDVIDNRYTPLMYACLFGKLEMVQLLIDSGANIMIKNNEGQLAQDYAKDFETARLIQKATKKLQKEYLEEKLKTQGIVIEREKGVKRATIFGL